MSQTQNTPPTPQKAKPKPQSAGNLLGMIQTPVTVGTPSSFRIKVNEGGELELNVDGPTQLEASMEETDDGVYDVTFTATQPGDYMFNMQVGDKLITGSPFVVTAKLPEPIPIPMNLEPKVTAQGAGLTEAISHILAEFDVLIGNHKIDDIQVSINGPEMILPTATKKGNLLHYHYTPRVPGKYKISIKEKGKDIEGSPFQLLVGSCKAFGKGLVEGYVNEMNDFRVELTEQLDGKVDVHIEGPGAQPEIQLKQSKKGTFDVSYRTFEPGTYSIHVKLNGKPIEESPFRVPIQSKAFIPISNI